MASRISPGNYTPADHKFAHLTYTMSPYYDQCQSLQSSTTSSVVKAPLVRASLVKRRYIKYLALPYLLPREVQKVIFQRCYSYVLLNIQIILQSHNRWPSNSTDLNYGLLHLGHDA